MEKKKPKWKWKINDKILKKMIWKKVLWNIGEIQKKLRIGGKHSYSISVTLPGMYLHVLVYIHILVYVHVSTRGLGI